MLPRRQKRLNELLRKAIGEIIELDLKGFFPGLITITHVKVNTDLSAAWVEYSVIGAEEEEAQRYLERSKHAIIDKLAHKVRLRSLPQLKFAPDQVCKQADRIEELIREIHRNEEDSSE